jgi:hypothetical protein
MKKIKNRTIEDEELLYAMRLSPQEKLAYLKSLNAFLYRTMPRKNLKIAERLRSEETYGVKQKKK